MFRQSAEFLMERNRRWACSPGSREARRQPAHVLGAPWGLSSGGGSVPVAAFLVGGRGAAHLQQQQALLSEHAG